ncbi:MAG: hypothetical protein KJ067_02625 [Vicinamibacteria bacterium]|jgi:hypothetical protein|nr:hypothetical protein [Vicinamibacteria bacterium]
MISGKLRGKAARSGAALATVRVDGAELAWHRRHGGLVEGSRAQVESFSVSLTPGRSRELVLDVTRRAPSDWSSPSERVVAAMLDAGIRSALAAGWDPESRGRAFRHEFAFDSGVGED